MADARGCANSRRRKNRYPRLDKQRIGVLDQAAVMEATEAPAPAASACAMVTARAMAFAIAAFDCRRIVAKGATRATVNLESFTLGIGTCSKGNRLRRSVPFRARSDATHSAHFSAAFA